MTSETDKFDVVVLSVPTDYSFTRNRVGRDKSRFIQMMLNDPRFNVKLMSPEELSKDRSSPPSFWIDEMTDIPVAIPLKQKPKPYWRQGERW